MKPSRQQRHRRIRATISGTAERPRLSVFRSNTGMTAQLIDDGTGATLVGVTSNHLSAADRDKSKTEQARALGALLAERAAEEGITTAVFDRGGYRYHGRVQALAEGAREGGLRF